MSDRLTRFGVQAFARRVAKSYGPEGRYPLPTLETILDVIASTYQRQPAICLDVGAGNGFPASLLSKRWPATRFLLLDVSIEMLARANERLSATSDLLGLTVADAVQLPVRSRVCDFVFCCSALHLMPDKRAIVGEAARVLSTSGALGLVFYDREDLRAQLIHQMFPEFFAHEAPFHPTKSEILGLLSAHELIPRVVQRFAYEVPFKSREEYLDYIAGRPYFSFIHYTDAEFTRAYQTFQRRVLTALPEKEIRSPGALTLVIASRKAQVWPS